MFSAKRTREYKIFRFNYRSQETRKKYAFDLKEYEKEYSLALNDPKAIEVRIINFINKMKKEGKSHAAIFTLCIGNQVLLSDKRRCP